MSMSGFGGDLVKFLDARNPQMQGLLQGLGQASMPSRLPVPFGAVLGQAASGLMQGQKYADEKKSNDLRDKYLTSQTAKLDSDIENEKALRDERNKLFAPQTQTPATAPAPDASAPGMGAILDENGQFQSTPQAAPAQAPNALQSDSSASDAINGGFSQEALARYAIAGGDIKPFIELQNLKSSEYDTSPQVGINPATQKPGVYLVPKDATKPLHWLDAAPQPKYGNKDIGINPATGKPEEVLYDDAGNPKFTGVAPPPKIRDVNGQIINDYDVKPGTVIQQQATPPLSQRRFDQQADLARINNAPTTPYDEPVLVEINDGQGGTKEVTAQQNKASGQWVTADQNRTPLDATNLRVIKSELPGGGRVAGQVIRITTAAHDIASELENISRLPATASTGLYSKAGTMGTPMGALAREVTSQEVQSYKTSAVGMARGLAALEAAGLAPPGALTGQFEGLQLQLGDTNLTKLQKMGTIRQNGENALDAILASPLLSKQQREEVTGLKARMAKAIPWTPLDVINLENSGNPRATLGDMAKLNRLTAPQAALPPSPNPGAALPSASNPSQRAMLPKMATPADAAKLAPGTRFLDANGVERVR